MAKMVGSALGTVIGLAFAYLSWVATVLIIQLCFSYRWWETQEHSPWAWGFILFMGAILVRAGIRGNR